MDYAIVFAVASRDCITVYSTQFRAPLAHLSSLHYANINDLRWSPEGDCLAACSSDGYITFVQFEQHLGEFCEEIYDDDLNLQAGVDNSNKSAAKSGRNKQVPGGNTAQNCKTTQTEVSVNM
ncbi:MAG: 3-oxoacyl-[acyl-carrier-protein] synthase [Marteilia pararefringens]